MLVRRPGRSLSLCVLGSFLSLAGAACHGDEASRSQLGAAESALSRPGALSAEVALEPPAYLPDLLGHSTASTVFNGEDWVALRYGTPARMTRISRDGRVRDPLGVPVGPLETRSGSSALATDGSTTAVASIDSDKRRLEFRRYDRALTQLGEPLVLAEPQRTMSWVAARHGDGQYLVVWMEYEGTGSSLLEHLRAVRVSDAGVLLDAEPIELSTSRYAWGTQIGWDGARFMVVWTAADRDPDGLLTNWRVLGARITTSGHVLEDPRSLAPGGYEADLCFHDGAYTMIWSTVPERTDDGAPPSDIFASRVASDLSLAGPPVVVAGGAGNQERPRCTVIGDSTLVSWKDDAPDQPDLRARFLSHAGALGAPFSLADDYPYGWAAIMATDGTQALALWLGGGTRITSSGERLDGASIAIANRTVSQESVAVASSGEAALAVFYDERPALDEAGHRTSLRVARVSNAGVPLDASSRLLVEGDGFVEPRVASDGRGYLVVWDEFSSSTTTRRVRASRVGLDGIPMATRPIQLAESTLNGFVGDVRVAASSDGYLVTWGDADVYGRRVSSDGTLLGPKLTIAAAQSVQSEARVAFDGEHYVATWYDQRQQPWGLWTARVGTDGSLLDPGGRRLTERGIELSGGHELAGGEGGAYAVWSAYVNGENRLHGSWIDESGEVAEPAGQLLPAHMLRASVARDGDGFTLMGESSGELFVTRVGESGEPLGGVLRVAKGVASTGALAASPDGTLLITYQNPDENDFAPRARVRQLAARSADVELDAGLPDPVVDAGVDAAVDPVLDASVDPVPDASVDPVPDASIDPVPDASIDPVPDASVDPIPDASVDPVPDASIVPVPDAGMPAVPDAGHDVPEDAGDGPVGPIDMTIDPAQEGGDSNDGCSCNAVDPSPHLDRGLWFLALAAFLVYRRRQAC